MAAMRLASGAACSVLIVACGSRTSLSAEVLDAAPDSIASDASKGGAADASGSEHPGRTADAADQDGTSGPCPTSPGSSYTASLEFAGVDRQCQAFLGNVVVINLGSTAIGPVSTSVVHVPVNGASWPAPHTSSQLIPPGGQVTITVGEGHQTPCPALACPGPVDVEVEISGAGIPAGARACGLATVFGC